MPVNIFTTIDDPLATQDTDPFGINGSGQIVGAFRTNSVFHGFVLSGGSLPSPRPSTSARSAWIFRSPASARFTHPAPPT